MHKKHSMIIVNLLKNSIDIFLTIAYTVLQGLIDKKITFPSYFKPVLIAFLRDFLWQKS